MQEAIEKPAGFPFHVMAKAMGPKCNLDCSYCFYLEKERLFAPGERFRMPDDALETFIRRYIEAQPIDQVSFAWQGGEPTLLGVEYFRKIVSLQKRYANGKRIENALQTNGTLLDDRWAAFLAEEKFLVGVSVDGPEGLHDTYRRDRSGGGSLKAALKGIQALQRFRVEWNSLTCVSRGNQDKPLEVYKFLRGIGSRYLQFIPIVERKACASASRYGLDHAVPPKGGAGAEESELEPWSVDAKAYGNFLKTIFDFWIRRDVGKIYVQHFDNALGKWLGQPGGICVFQPTCGDAVALEHDGSVYSCDHYVYPEYRLGNLMKDSLAEMLESPFQRSFGQAKSERLPKACLECRYKAACHGGCPKHRFETASDGEPGLNYLCPGYYAFFTHAEPLLTEMAQLYRSGRPPALIMERLQNETRGRRN